MANLPLSWGKPTIFIKDLGTSSAKWKKLATPVEDSTQLNTTQGEKKEAKIEGGENEAAQYKANTYQFLYNIRKAGGRKQPMANKNGVVTHEYAVLMQPEDAANTDGLYIERTTANVVDNWTSADGAIWQVTHDALAASVGNTVKWGKVTTATSSGKSTVAFTENSDMMAEGQTTAVTVAASEYEE